MKFDRIVLIEQANAPDLYPFSIMHCAWECRSGAFRAFERIERQFPAARINFAGRREHLDSFLARFGLQNDFSGDGDALMIDSSVIGPGEFMDMLARIFDKHFIGKPALPIQFSLGAAVVAYYLPAADAGLLVNSDLESVALGDIEAIFIRAAVAFDKIALGGSIGSMNYLWDALEINGEAIGRDAKFFDNKADLVQLVRSGVHIISPQDIYIGGGCEISPSVMLDASTGAVIIDDNVKIMPQATVLEPCYIGKNSIIKIGAKIYPNTSIGEWCKVGGEVENSIIHAYSNKQHDGFLGHSYIGEWVNLGADTNTSDLKNTYSNIKVMLESREIDTKRMFLGLLCGDHTKTAINTSFTTGSVAGICGVIVCDATLPRQIGSFAWGGGRRSTHYKLGKALEVAAIVMKRRSRVLLQEEIVLIGREYDRITTINKSL